MTNFFAKNLKSYSEVCLCPLKALFVMNCQFRTAVSQDFVCCATRV